MPRTVPDELANVRVKDEAEGDVRLGDLWKDHTAVVAFVRHFG